MPTDDAQFLGLDIGGTKCAAVVGSADGKIVARNSWPSNATRGPRPMIEELCAASAELISKHSKIVSIGVSIGGPLDAENGIILSPPNLPGWNHIPLRDTLHQRLHLPVRVEHDAAACCLAEVRWGAGAGKSRVIYLTCGTGFGAGIVFNGQIASAKTVPKPSEKSAASKRSAPELPSANWLFGNSRRDGNRRSRPKTSPPSGETRTSTPPKSSASMPTPSGKCAPISATCSGPT